MKIDPKIPIIADQTDRVSNAPGNRTQTQSSTRPPTTSSSAGEDTVSLSSTHGEIQILVASVANVPEVRTARLNALQQQVSAGQYQPASHDIAAAILRDVPRIHTRA